MEADRRDMGRPLLLRRARVWTGDESSPAAAQDIPLAGGVVAEVAAGLRPRDAEVVDLDGRIVTAGLWNCHVHLTEPAWRSGGSAVQEALDDMMLRRGFTTVVDLGSDPRTTAAVARAIDTGRLRGPQILTAGAGLRPWRGLPFYLKDTVPWLARMLMPGPLTALGARIVVAAQIRRGADVVKLFTGSYVAPGTVRTMRPAVARAAVRSAHARGAKVFAHTSDRAGTQIALDAGVDVLAHVPDTTAGTCSSCSTPLRSASR